MSFENFTPNFLTLTDHDDVVVVAMTRPHLNDEENIDQLGLELFTIVDQYDRDRIVLDLGRVEYMTSSVIGKIIALHRRLHRGSGRLVICNIGETVETILRTASLLQYFRVAVDVPAALDLLDDE